MEIVYYTLFGLGVVLLAMGYVALNAGLTDKKPSLLEILISVILLMGGSILSLWAVVQIIIQILGPAL